MKTSIKRDASGMPSSYKHADFGEMKRGEYVAFAQAEFKQNTASATLLTNGRVTIPKAIRDALHLTAGATVNFTLRPDGTVILRA
jgi:AbrB family looped-hinge helix DNA binding protein